MIKCSKRLGEGSCAKCSVCRCLLWLSTDRSSFTHLVTRCDVAELGFEMQLKGQNETTDDLVQSPFPAPFSREERQGKAEWMGKSFLTLKKSDFTAHDSSKRQNHWQPECQSLSWNHQPLQRAICKASPACTPVTLQFCEQNTDTPSTDPSGNEQNFPSASSNLTRIYKPFQMDVSILFHLGICANMLIHTVNFTVNAKFGITQPDTNS